MIYVHKTHDYHKIHEIFSNPILFSATYGQAQDSLSLYDLEGKEFVLIQDEDVVLGCSEIRPMSRTTLEVHLAVLPQYWSRTKEIVKAADEWAADQGYLVLFCQVPANCIPILKFLQRMGYTACGQVPNGIIYHKELTTLFLFQKQLKGN